METIELDVYVLDTLMRDLVGHDRQPSAYLVYLYLWRLTGGVEGRSVAASLRELAEGTGLSKRAVQDALGRLQRRGLVESRRESVTAVPELTLLRPWARR